MTVRAVVEGVVTLAVGVMAVVVIWGHLGAARDNTGLNYATAGLPESPISTGDAVKGSPQARVVLLVFSDFECEYCRRFATEVQPVLEERYLRPGALQIAFRHLPNENTHAHARQAASAAACAGRQSHFWDMHDLLFAMKPAISRTGIRAAAIALSLDSEAFDDCVADEAGGVIDRDLNDGAALRLSGTPSFFIGTRNADGTVTTVARIRGMRSLGTFTAGIDAALNR